MTQALDPSAANLPTTSQPRGIAASESGTTYLVTANGIQVFEGGNEAFNLPVNYNPSSVTVTSNGELVAVGGNVRTFPMTIIAA